jgi:hypothetical protein
MRYEIDNALLKSLLPAVVQAEDMLARLDERAARSPVGEGFTERGHFFDAAGALWAFKAAIERGGATRAGINGALETKLRGLVTPAGRIFLGPRNHQGLQLDSMWVGRIDDCKVKPLFGKAFAKKK